MHNQTEKGLRNSIKRWIVFFIIALVISGLSAFPIETQLAWGVNYLPWLPDFLYNWINQVYEGIKVTNQNYPFLAYGTDWLAFAHIVIAISFIGPFFDPIKNIWVIQYGMIACVLILPLAWIAGPVREIPVYWRFIDSLFGIIGIIPLIIVYRKIKKLEKLI
jgi:hypothetical protein